MLAVLEFRRVGITDKLSTKVHGEGPDQGIAGVRTPRLRFLLGIKSIWTSISDLTLDFISRESCSFCMSRPLDTAHMLNNCSSVTYMTKAILSHPSEQ